MRLLKKLSVVMLAGALLLSPAACGDDPGEDQIGDNEIIDEGD